MTEVMNTREPVMEEFVLSQTPEEEGGPSSQVTSEKNGKYPKLLLKSNLMEPVTTLCVNAELQNTAAGRTSPEICV